MLCAEPAAVEALSKRCGNCGESKPLTSFRRDPNGLGGLRADCRGCERLAARARRVSDACDKRRESIPCVLGISDAATLSTAVLGALRQHYDGRPAGLVDDLRKTMVDADPVERMNEVMVFMAMRDLEEL